MMSGSSTSSRSLQAASAKSTGMHLTKFFMKALSPLLRTGRTRNEERGSPNPIPRSLFLVHSEVDTNARHEDGGRRCRLEVSRCVGERVVVALRIEARVIGPRLQVARRERQDGAVRSEEPGCP